MSQDLAAGCCTYTDESVNLMQPADGDGVTDNGVKGRFTLMF